MHIPYTIKALPCALILCSCSQRGYETFSGYAQGGQYSIKADLSGVRTPSSTISANIDSLLRDIDNSISGYNHASLLSRRNSGEDIIPDRHFSRLLELSDQFSRISDGAFDVWGAPLYDIWGFGFKDGRLPSKEQVEQALQACRNHTTINFNAIAQGYSCDVIADYLRSIGVKNMLVDIGEIYCQGTNPKGKAWAVGVDRPIDGNNSPGASIQAIWHSDASGQGIVTSGNYRKFYIVDGKKYAHTIDPKTGYPVEHSLLSATVIAPTAAMADALATACMVMGEQKAITLIESLEEVEAFLISSDHTWTSEGFNLE